MTHAEIILLQMRFCSCHHFMPTRIPSRNLHTRIGWFSCRLEGTTESENPRGRGAVLLEGQRCARGVVRVFLAPESAPNPPPALVSYNNTPSVLKAALGRVRLPAVGVAGRKSIPLARRVGASFQRPLECIRTSYRSNFVDRCPSGPRSTFTEYALPTGRGLTCGDG